MAVDELAQACAYLPLALRVAAANLNDQPHRTVAAHVEELRSGNRLASLAVQDDDQAAVRSAFDLSYQDIEVSVRSTFRLLGLVPGRDFTVDAVSALAGLSRGEASRHMALLSNAHLIEQVGRDRYTFHDLLRLYASERASAEDTKSTRTQALQRLFDWYLQRVDAAAKILHPNLIRISVPEPATDETTVSPFQEPTAAADWLDSESVNIIAAVHYAGEYGPRNMAWLLVSGARGHFVQRRHLADWLPATQVAVAAASEHGDKRAQAAARLALAHAHQTRYEPSSAVNQLLLAAKLANDASWPELRATCVGNLVGVLYDLGSLDEAVAAATESLNLAVEAGYRFAEAQALNNLGLLKLRMGLLVEATEILRTSAELYMELGGGSAEMLASSYLAESLRLQGRPAEAFALLGTAKDAAHRANVTDALPLQIHAKVCLDLGLTDQAAALAAQAYNSASRVGHRFYESMALVAMGSVLLAKCEYQAALAAYERGMDLAKSADARFAAVEAAIGLASTWSRLKDHGRAQEEASAALESARELGLRVTEGEARTVLARIEFGRGNAGKALTYARGALENHRRTGYRLGEADTLMLLAELESDPATAQLRRQRAEQIYEAVRSTVLKEFMA